MRRIEGPLNVLAGPKSPPLDALKALGVARVSVGGAIARAAYALTRHAAEEMQTSGTYEFSRAAIPHPEMNALLKP